MIPSLLQIPSAVSDSKLHSVLPNNGKGDFTFDRSTGATRINRDGLIEEVGYFSSELVQNGNFSELGSELVTNGNFVDNFDNWTVASYGGVISGELNLIDGALRITKTSNSDWRSSFIRQTITYTSGKTYRINFKIKGDAPSANIYVRSGYDSSGQTIAQGISLTGQFVEYTYYFVADSNSVDISFGNVNWQNAGTGQSFEIDNVSVKQVDPNDRWIKGSGWSYGANKILGSNTNTFDTIVQDNIAVLGKQVKLTFDIVDYTSGTFRLFPSDRQDNLDQRYSGNGSYQVLYIPTVNNLRFQQQNFVGGITNISLVEVQGDRPRLSYDITNGVVEDTPHLLLEPSATNLVTFSEDFSQSYWSKTGTSISSDVIKSPDGTLNAYNLVENTSGGGHYIVTASNISVSNSSAYSQSIFVKQNGRTKIGFRDSQGSGKYASFNLTNGTLIEQNGDAFSINTLTNGWYRISVTMNASGTLWKPTLYLLPDSYTTGSPQLSTYTGDGVSGIYIWGAMLEQQAFSSSYIKTAGTAITRAAETSYLHNIDDGVLNQSGFTLFLDTNLLNDTVNNFRDIIALYNTAGSITMRLETRTNGQVYIQQTGVVSSGDNFNSATFGSNSVDFKKFAISCSTSEVQLWADGNKINDYTGSYVFTFDKLGFRGNDSVVETILKHKGVAIYNDILSESQLFQLTGVTASSIYNNFVTRTASFTVEALNEVKKVIDNL